MYFFHSTQVPLGVLFRSEQKNEDMLDILKHVHTYVPMVQSTTTVTTVVNGIEEETLTVHLTAWKD